MSLSQKVLKLYRAKLEEGTDNLKAQNEVLTELSPGPPFDLPKRKNINAIIDSAAGLKITREYVPPTTWNVHSLDVWGNEDDGFEVNNEFKAGTVELPYGATDEELLKIFKEDHLEANVTLKSVSFDEQSSEGFFVIENKKTGEPLFHVYQQS